MEKSYRDIMDGIAQGNRYELIERKLTGLDKQVDQPPTDSKSPYKIETMEEIKKSLSAKKAPTPSAGYKISPFGRNDIRG